MLQDDDSDVGGKNTPWRPKREESTTLPATLFAASSLTRRQALLQSLSAAAAGGCYFMVPNEAAEARGLVQFPVDSAAPLSNKYHFMRVGNTLLEETDDIWTTNPLFLTNREAALSPTGIEQVQAACLEMEKAQETPTVVKYSLAASALDAAQIVGDTLDLGRDRLVPEFTYLDPRGIGQWDMYRYSTTLPAVWALDVMEAGPEGRGGRPPANQDGTPNETLADQAVRLRQVMSILETLYSGETILVIFPDGTGPALLSAMIAGISLSRVHELEFSPGELRLDITPSRTQQLWRDREASNANTLYKETIAKGQKELARLRETATSETLSLKDEKMEIERNEIERVYQEDQEAKRLQNDEEEEELKQKRREIQAAKRLSVDQDGNAVTASNPVIAAGAAFGVVGLAGIFAASGSGSGSDREERGASSMSRAIDWETETNQGNSSGPAKGPGISAERPLPDSSDNPLLDVALPLSSVSSLPGPPEPASEEDRLMAAEEAMRQYMEQDDGAEDWLSTISELAQDNTEDFIDESDDYPGRAP